MNAQLFIALLTPALSLIYASAFFLLWTYRRRRHVIVLSVSYLACACGFLLQSFDLPLIDHPISRFLSNALLMFAAVTLSAAAITRHGRAAPLVVLCGLGIAGLAALGWFLFVKPDITDRIFAINFALGGVSLVVAAELRAIANKGIVDRVLMTVSTVGGIDFFIRPLVSVWIDGGYKDIDAFLSSTYWLWTNFSMALFSVLIAMSLITAIALDVMKELQAESHTDPLSGLLNRRGFEERSAVCAKQHFGGALPLALVLADLDHFKSVNDTYGHAVIAAFAAHLSASCGKDAIVGRIGGEEFAIVLPASDLMTARLFAEGVRASFTQTGIRDLPGDALRITASFGVANRAANENFESLMRRADQALYRAKKNGRDSVRLADPHTQSPDLLAPNFFGGHI